MIRTTYTAINLSDGRVVAVHQNTLQMYAQRLNHNKVALVKIEGSTTYEGYYDIRTGYVLWKTVEVAWD